MNMMMWKNHGLGHCTKMMAAQVYDTETLNHISSSSRIITPVVCVPYYRCLGDSFVGNVRVSLVNLHNKVHTSLKS